MPEINKQIKQGMAVPPFKRILRKCYSGNQTQFTIPPTNYASLNGFPTKPPPPKLTISEVKHQVIPLSERYTFRRVENDKVDAMCQKTEGKEKQDTECQTATMEEEDTPLFRS